MFSHDEKSSFEVGWLSRLDFLLFNKQSKYVNPAVTIWMENTLYLLSDTVPAVPHWSGLFQICVQLRLNPPYYYKQGMSQTSVEALRKLQHRSITTLDRDENILHIVLMQEIVLDNNQ